MPDGPLPPPTGTWLPPTWEHPARVELPTGHHLRPLRATDVDLHMLAVTGSQERLWAIYGAAAGWPPENLDAERDREELLRLEVDMTRHRAFGYALFDLGETELLGCVHLRPSRECRTAADISWWVVDWLVDGPVERALDAFVPAWVGADWPFAHPRVVWSHRDGPALP
jgi:hypothetical protein